MLIRIKPIEVKYLQDVDGEKVTSLETVELLNVIKNEGTYTVGFCTMRDGRVGVEVDSRIVEATELDEALLAVNAERAK